MSLSLPTPSDFPAFPYETPYSIQVDLMKCLYSSIEKRKVTIVESPTGTGKTLSLLCASLTWLADERNRARKGQLDSLAPESGELDWVAAQTQDRHRRELEATEEEYEKRLAEARKREQLLRKKAKARKLLDENNSDSDDDRFMPEGEDLKDNDNFSPEVRALMERLEKGLVHRDVTEPEPTCTKIYYASRTHSQLSQVLPELRKLNLRSVPSSRTSQGILSASSSKNPYGKRRVEDKDLEFAGGDTSRSYSRTVALGSRKQLCVNVELRTKRKDLDEGCRELLGEKGAKRCQYLPSTDEFTRMADLRDQILADPKDIEDLADAGRLAQTCPYFGSRLAIPQAEVPDSSCTTRLVTLPYNLLLQKSTREALGIDLTDQIVIIDEAHNLISTLLSLSSAPLSIETLCTSLDQVARYLTRFRTRLSPINVLHLTRLVAFLNALKIFAMAWSKPAQVSQKLQDKTEVMTVAELLERLGRKATSINLLEIQTYLHKSKVARKIGSYAEKLTNKAAKADPQKSSHAKVDSSLPLHAVEAFMVAVSGANSDGRITISCIDGKIEIKYQLLNPATHFVEVLNVARSVILAGGTMSPMSDFINQLFSNVPAGRLSTFSCGHIIPPSSIQTIVVKKGPCGRDLEFKYNKQGESSLISELGQVIFNLVNMVPRGVVVFFPSYKFLNSVQKAWNQNGLMAKLSAKKKTFLEPESSTDVERILKEYSAEILASMTAPKKAGALLFAVIGAKLSEGLNFSDDLARAVVVVGLPFANIGSPELKERMKYVNELEKAAGGPPAGSKDAASELYENMCMNAVNQSIGRAIRHQRDWASLILIDSRYESTRIRKKLPAWIGQDLTVAQTFGEAVKSIGSFYRSRLL